LALSLDIDLLRSFAAVAESGALSRAGERVGRTQSALSMQMKRLEEIVGQPLLNRTGRGVSLTAAGERLLSHAGKILLLNDQALSELRGQQLIGKLRLGCPDDYAVAILPPLLHAFAGEHPQVQLEVVCGPTPRMRELLGKHAIDLALLSLTADLTDVDILRLEPLVWVVKRGGNALAMDPLPLALGPPDCFDHLAPRKALEDAGLAYRVVYACGSLTGLIAMARAGQAVTVVTATSVPADLEVVSPEAGLPPLPFVGITVAFDKEEPGALASAFADHVRRMLRPLPTGPL
jgi:DNA-binding transcriptional LysR family regulator